MSETGPEAIRRAAQFARDWAALQRRRWAGKSIPSEWGTGGVQSIRPQSLTADKWDAPELEADPAVTAARTR